MEILTNGTNDTLYLCDLINDLNRNIENPQTTLAGQIHAMGSALAKSVLADEKRTITIR